MKGMPNDSRRKETLYEAETIDELKKKLKAYELSKPEKHTEKQHNGQSKHQGKREPKPMIIENALIVEAKGIQKQRVPTPERDKNASIATHSDIYRRIAENQKLKEQTERPNQHQL